MPRLLRSARDLQYNLLVRVKASENPPISCRRVATMAGVDPTLPSKWVAEGEDGREMPLAAALRLAEAVGWDVVLGDEAKAAGWRIVREDAEPVACIRSAGVDLSVQAADLLRGLHAALADGTVDALESVELRAKLRELRQLTHQIEARIR